MKLSEKKREVNLERNDIGMCVMVPRLSFKRPFVFIYAAFKDTFLKVFIFFCFFFFKSKIVNDDL